MPSTLQEEIRQTRPFARRSAEALLSVLRTATVLEHEMNEALRAHGITLTQFNVLRILNGAGKEGLCGRDIGSRLISNVPDISRLLDRMEETELVTRTRDTVDRRHVTSRISQKGRKVMTQAEPDLETIERKRVKRLDPHAIASLIDALAVIREQR